MSMEKENHQFEEGFLVRHRIFSAVKKVEFVSNRLSYIILRGRWYNIVLNVHAPSEKKVMIRKTVFMRIWSRFLSFSKLPY